MTILAGSILELSVGDGGSPTEIFHPLPAATVLEFEITQRLIDNPAIATDAWANSAVGNARRLALTCEAAAGDGAAASRLRAIAFSGDPANVQLTVNGSEAWAGSFMVTQYRETGASDDVKRLLCQLESVTTVAPAPSG